MHRLIYLLVLGGSAIGWAQSSSAPANSSSSNSQPTNPQSTNSQTPGAASSAKKSDEAGKQNQEPPHSGGVTADSPGKESSDSSSKDAQVDLSPPADDAKKHPHSSEAIWDAEMSSGDVNDVHPWDPHRAAKDIEVGDFYFKNKNYRAAEDRYREALYYKDNDTTATFRLAECLEKLGQPTEALSAYQRYLKILPYGENAKAAKKAIDRLSVADTKLAK